MLILLLVLCISIAPTLTAGAEANTTPQLIETGIGWKIENSTLYLTGNGAMKNYTDENSAFGDQPRWYERHSEITKIVFNGNITAIGDYAFAYLENLTDVTIPSSVRKIGECAFGGCSSLTSVTIPKSVKIIGEGAFAACDNLNAIYYAGNEEEWFEVDSYAMDYDIYCNADKNPQLIETGIRWEIEDSTLYLDGNGAMKNYTDENSAFGDQPRWYSRRSEITKIVFNGNITAIGDYAFAFLENLTDVTIPSSVRKIGECAFGGCSSLTSITIPKSVKIIGEGAFAACDNLNAIYYAGNEEEWFEVDSYAMDYDIYCNCIPSTVTTVSADGKSFTIKPAFVGKDNVVILALYKENRFIQLYHTAYQGNEITFTVTEDYDRAKVFVWKDFNTAIPITKAEPVK